MSQSIATIQDFFSKQEKLIVSPWTKKKCGLFETEEMTAWNDSSEEQTYNWNDLTDLIVAIKRRIKIKMALIASWRYQREPEVVTPFEVVFAK